MRRDYSLTFHHGPSQNVFFLVSLDFFQQARWAISHKTCVIQKASCRLTMSWSYSEVIYIRPVSPSITLHILKWSNFSLEFFYVPSHVQRFIYVQVSFFLGHSTGWIHISRAYFWLVCELWGLPAWSKAKGVFWYSLGIICKHNKRTRPVTTMWFHRKHMSGASLILKKGEEARFRMHTQMPRCMSEHHAVFSTQTANTKALCYQPGWPIWAGRFK